LTGKPSWNKNIYYFV